MARSSVFPAILLTIPPAFLATLASSRRILLSAGGEFEVELKRDMRRGPLTVFPGWKVRCDFGIKPRVILANFCLFVKKKVFFHKKGEGGAPCEARPHEIIPRGRTRCRPLECALRPCVS